MVNYDIEKNMKAKIICGVDEAGRGPLAGPVVAAAVILDENNIPEELNDSKKLSEKKRQEIFENIMEKAYCAVASVSAKVIDKINIRNATLIAMKNAVKQLEIKPEIALIDGNAIPQNMPCKTHAIIKGDQKSMSIAAASIIAKVTRDKIMCNVARQYPKFDFQKHKGYGTKSHREKLKMFKPTPIHRMTFAPISENKNKTKAGEK